MRRSRVVSQFVLLALFPILFASPSFARDPGPTVVQRDDVREDLYLAGGSVYSLGRVDGDLVVAGGQVEIEKEITGDVLAAGGSISVRARVRDDLRAGGGHVSINGTIGDDAIVAGGRVLIAPTASVGGRAWLAGGNVEVYGKVGRQLRAAGGNIVVSGEVKGDVELIGGSIEIGPGAVIDGNLSYRSRNEARIDPGATIRGSVTRLEMPLRERDERAFAGAARIGLYLSLIVTAIVLLLVFPSAASGAARAIRTAPWKTLGLGIALLAATPLVIVLLAVTLLGVWLALLLLAAYLALLLTGFLTGVLAIGDFALGWIVKRRKATTGLRVLSIVAALVALWIVGFIPFLGGLVCFAVLMFGLGGLALYLCRGYVDAR